MNTEIYTPRTPSLILTARSGAVTVVAKYYGDMTGKADAAKLATQYRADQLNTKADRPRITDVQTGQYIEREG